MQGCLFIVHRYLGFKIKEPNFFHHHLVHHYAWAHEMVWIDTWGSSQDFHMHMAQQLQWEFCTFRRFSSVLPSWNALEFEMNFSQTSIVFKYFKTIDLQSWISLIFHVMTCFSDLHYFSLKSTKNTYGIAWFRIKLNYNDSNKNNIKCTSNHW